MEVYCTRPKCQHPINYFADLDDIKTLKTAQQRYCTNCGMSLILPDRYLPIKLLGRGGFRRAFLLVNLDNFKIRNCRSAADCLAIELSSSAKLNSEFPLL